MKDIKFLFLTCLIVIFCFNRVSAQDIIVRTNGARLKAKIIKVSVDSVNFKSYDIPGNPIFSLPKKEIKFIEYYNNKIEYFEGSYLNSSKLSESKVATGIVSAENIVIIQDIRFSVENLFTENHLILDFSYHQDSNLQIGKGKVEFVFENKKYNFSSRIYPIDEMTVFAKFEFSITGENKKYDYLSDQNLVSILFYIKDYQSVIALTKEQSMELKKLFLGKNIARTVD